jgi:hypothetical protein
LFAQGLEWSGSGKTGMKFIADDDNNGKDIKVDMYHSGAEKPLRLELNGKYTQDNYGAVFGVRFDPAAFGAPGGDPATPETDVVAGLFGSVYNAYGWITFVNDIIKVSAGKIDDGVWKTGGPEDYGIKGDGLRLEIAPITGLNLGLMLRAPKPTLTVKQFLSETALGAKYSSDLFWVAAGIILDSTVDGLEDGYDGYESLVGGKIPTFADVTPGATDSDHGLVFQAGAGTTIAGLSFAVEAKAVNASKLSDRGYFILDEDVSYKLLDDKLKVGLKAYQYFFGADWSEGIPTGGKAKGDADADESLKPLLKFTPYLGYTLLANVDVGLEATIGLWKYVYDLDFSIKPSVTYKVGENAEIGASYKLAILDFYDDLEIPDRESNKGNTIQVDFTWKF